MQTETEENLISLPLKKPNEKELAKVLGYKPNYWQEIVRQSDARFKVLVIGTRGGKTHYATYDTKDGLVADLASRDKYVWICSASYDLTQRIWSELRKLCLKEPFRHLIKSFNNTKGYYNLETYLGTRIEAKSLSDPERLVGVGLDKIIIDEAGQKETEKAWKVSLRTRLIDMGKDAKGIFIGTPFYQSGFLYNAFLKGQDLKEIDWQSWNFSTMDNKDPITGKLLLKGGLEELEKIKRDLSEEDYKRNILAQFTEFGHLVFRNFNRFEGTKYRDYNPEHLYLMGVDLGRVRNKTVIFIINQFTFNVDYCEAFSREDWQVVINRIKAVWEKYGKPQGYFDATSTGGDVVGELLANKGVGLTPFTFTDKSKREAINKLAYFLEKKLTYPKTLEIENFIKECENYVKEESEKSGRLLYKSISTKYGEDFITALALAVWDLPDEPITSKLSEVITFPSQDY